MSDKLTREMVRRIAQQRERLDYQETLETPTQPVLLPESDFYVSATYAGGSFSTAAKTLITLATDLTHRTTAAPWPYHARYVYLRVVVRDSGAATTEALVILGATNEANWGVPVRCFPANNRYNDAALWVPCNVDGNFWLQRIATGVNTLQIIIQAAGYKL